MKKQSAFTLIELMIVMAIIAILATAGLAAYSGYIKKSRDTARAEIAQKLNTAVMSYAASNGGNPPASPTAFESFLASAGEVFSGTGVTGGTLVKDPVGGKDVCLDAEDHATEPCRFDYTAYSDGTYAISYGVEDKSSTERNFYKTTQSVGRSTNIDTSPIPVTKYGVYLGSAPFIGSTPTTSNGFPPPAEDGVDTSYIPIGSPAPIPMIVVPLFLTTRIDAPSGGESVIILSSITFDSQGGPAVSTISRIVSGATISLPAGPALAGYTFAGWNTAADGSGDSYAEGTNYTIGDNNITLYAKWTANTFTVTYNGNSKTSGTVPSNQTKTYGVDLTLATNSGTLARTGYTFAGWNTMANGSGVDYAVGANYTENASVTLYAKWTANNYTITFNASGGTGTMAPQTLATGATATLNLNTFTKTGYTFGRWMATASSGPFGDIVININDGASYTMGTSDITFSAVWALTSPSTYAVSYNANGATGGILPSNQTKTHNVPLTLRSNGFISPLVKKNYTFSGWNTAANGTGTSYAAGGSYTANSSVVLYAKWVP